MARLDSICTMNMGQSPDSTSYNETGEGIPFFQGNVDFGEKNPQVRVWCSAPTKIAHDGDILISVRAPIGALNIADTECCIGRGLAALTVNEKVCVKKYLWYGITSKVDELNFKGTGSTFKAISKNVLAETEIPLPSMEQQQRIAATLDKVNDLIDLRKQQLSKLDELIKSRFIEMFGDPESNHMGWDFSTIRDVVNEVKYGTSLPAVDGGKYKYLRMNSITYDGQLDLSDLKRINIPDDEIEKFVAHKGDVLFNRTNSKELVGKTCVFNTDEPMIIAGYLIRVRVNERILPEFLSTVLNSDYGKRTLFGLCKAAIGQANINAQELQDIMIPIPPIELQKEFSKILQKVDKSKFEIQKSLEKLETLKKALMQKYFG